MTDSPHRQVKLKRGPTFILDRADNPHPRMLAEAIEARRKARAIGGKEATYYWVGFMDAMCAATGLRAEELNRWIDSHAGEASFDGSATRVELRGRK